MSPKCTPQPQGTPHNQTHQRARRSRERGPGRCINARGCDMGWSLWMPDENELFRRIDEVLYYVWDPMDVRGIPAARDEYRAWAPEIYTLVTSDLSADQLS